MRFSHIFILSFVSFVAFARSEDIYSRKLSPAVQLTVSLSPEQIDHQQTYDLKLAPLPISISEAGEAALIENSLHDHVKTDRTDIESVELKQYKAPTGQSDFGKYFYLVTLRSVVHEPQKDRWSFLTRWAIFPDRMAIRTDLKEIQAEQGAAANP